MLGSIVPSLERLQIIKGSRVQIPAQPLTFMEFDHEIISKVIPLPSPSNTTHTHTNTHPSPTPLLIQKEQLLVTNESMCISIG